MRREKEEGPRRRKSCWFCENRSDFVDYKDDKLIRRYVNDRGKIIPRRITGTCATHQREVAQGVKRARLIALLPYVADTLK